MRLLICELGHDRTKAVTKAWDELAAKELAEFNAMLAARHLTGIVTKP
jgi:hypothetical protein